MTRTELAQLRKETLRLTQQQLADRLQLRRATIADYERGAFPVPVVVALAVRALILEPVTTS